jgi:hypothetical protein
MDFSGATPREAAERLFDFVQHLADEKGMDFGYQASGASLERRCEVYACSISGASFYLEMNIRGDSPLLAALALFRSRHGHGQMAGAGNAALLELRSDDEGIYRWHRLPANLDKSGTKLRRCRDALWFPLMSEYVEEFLLTSSEAAPEVGTAEPR